MLSCERTLQNHMNYQHKGIDFKCKNCEKSFAEKKTLDRHVQAVHNGQKISCELCEKSFTSKQNLKRHVQKHTKVKIKCKQVGFPT